MPQLTPGAVAEVRHAVLVAHPGDERVGPLEGVVVVFQNRVHAVLLEQRAPELPVLLHRSRQICPSRPMIPIALLAAEGIAVPGVRNDGYAGT